MHHGDAYYLPAPLAMFRISHRSGAWRSVAARAPISII
jgi:hypothetical protein